MKQLISQNNILKKILKIASPVLFGILFVTSSVSAQSTPILDVTFSSTPLFNVSNFLPGDIEDASVSIKNNSGTSQSAYVEAVTVIDPDGLGSQMRVKIFNGVNQIYTDEFDDFLNAGPVSLTSIASGDTQNYRFEVSFIDSADDDYMGKTLGFDLCFGFSGGEQRCTNTTSVGGEQNTGGGGGGGGGGGTTTTTTGGGGGGGGNGPITPQELLIFNENAQNIGSGFSPEETTTATIVWNTNIPATSQVVYGPDTTTYTFDINNLPWFGYPFGTTEDLTKKINHSVLLSGLIPGQTYVYRVVSRASPPTISYEHKFTVPLLAQNTNPNSNPNNTVNSISTTGSIGVGEVNNEEGTGNDVENEENTEGLNENLALAIGTGFGDLISLCTLIALLILLAIYIVWRLWLRDRLEKKGLSPDRIKTKFFEFVGWVTAIVIIVFILFKYYCPLPILIIAFAISVAICLYRRFVLKK